MLARIPGIVNFSSDVNVEARKRIMLAPPTWWRDPTQITDRRILKLLRNVEIQAGNNRRNMTGEPSDSMIMVEALAMTMNVILLEKHSDIFSMSHAMSGVIVRDQYQKDLTVKSMRFNTRMMENDTTWRNPQQTQLMARLTQAEIEAVVDDLADELRSAADLVRAEGNVLAPYIPIIVNGLIVDPNSFEPFLNFSSQYAIAKA
ncbi:MAG: hypothetical protein EOP83_12410 [Verrucomicrobiaceae bacterium]|nr:MAG: hypothetical protein EOP83_12410 [Verrucomicrobiaceae bacterium]